MSLNHLGLSLAAIGKLDEAKLAFAQALTHQELLAAMFPANAEVQSVLGSVLNNLGFLQQKTGRKNDAKRTFDAAVKSQNLAVELAPEVPRYRTFLEKHKQNLLQLGGPS
jgi:Flp pilus assembly protein TadD